MSSLTCIEAALPNAKAVFTTRLGGVSRGPYADLNLGISTDDDPDLVRENRELLAGALERDSRAFAMGRQVHGTDVQVQVDSRHADLVEADANVTANPDLTPIVLVADCVPLLLATPRAVAAVHCGWRGIAGGIVTAALEALRAQGEGDVSAAIGPGIGPCCYEVGEDVASAFRKRALDDAIDGNRLDLAQAIRSELERGGVHHVSTVDLCTSCNPDLFFSHRRDRGITGRQAGLAWLAK